MIDDKRLRESFWLLGRILPIDEQHKAAIEAMFGSNGTELISGIMQMIAELCRQKKEDAEMYFEFIKELIDYSTGKTDTLPEVEYDDTKLKQLMAIQLGYYKEQKEKSKK